MRLVWTVLLVSGFLWFSLGYIGVGVLKYSCVEVMPKLYGPVSSSSYWGYEAHQAAKATFFMGPFGLWSQISQVREIQKEHGKDKVTLGFKF